MQLLKHARRRRDEEGAAALEFALVIMPLLLVVAGIVNFGFAFGQQISLDNGAREGARFAAVDRSMPACGQIQARALGATWVRNPAPAFRLTGTPGPCERPCAGSAANTEVTVELAITSEPLIRLPLPTFDFPGFGDVAMTGRGVFRCEYR
ncbi:MULTISPECIES: TadE/TadG family type IV pilus assembly protein [Nocardioides]|jgi:Flp pilus assembly pilin Flp|uniref:TadE/TadG family type IV pilus assembly protein n=1 Tax=Nocardioides TaxID=1839 RepID=UPI0003311F22|nr:MULTISPECIES: TadE family protein [Nocardioides]EON23333.1 TadE family protein [Nocardioides sp. CF8]